MGINMKEPSKKEKKVDMVSSFIMEKYNNQKINKIIFNKYLIQKEYFLWRSNRKGFFLYFSGIYYYTSGARFEGEWKHGKMNGFGKMYNPQGIMKQSGKWKNGFMIWS